MNYRKRPLPTTTTESVLLELTAARMRQVRLMRLAFDGAPMPPDEFAVYSLLRFRGPIAPAAFAKALGMQRSTLSNYLARLDERGDLVRERDPKDGRSSRIALSTAGRARTEAATPFFARAGRPFHERLGARRGDYANALREISAALEETTAEVLALRRKERRR